MLATELLRKKRDLGTLSREEMSFFFQSFLKGDVADYQASAMLMAFCMGGLSDLEIQALTETMIHSGKIAAWPVAKNKLVDKHSTGGIGDKVSLVLLPLCCLEGLYVPMMSGRGLGHTGGTLDKLESIPGMRVRLELSEAAGILEKQGECLSVKPRKSLLLIKDCILCVT